MLKIKKSIYFIYIDFFILQGDFYMKINSIKQLIDLLNYDNIDDIFANYIDNYIESNKLNIEINKLYKDDFIPKHIYANPINIYRYNFIHCLPNEYSIMTQYLQQYLKDYEYNINNKEFIDYMMDSAARPVYWDYFPGDKINEIFIQH